LSVHAPVKPDGRRLMAEEVRAWEAEVRELAGGATVDLEVQADELA